MTTAEPDKFAGINQRHSPGGPGRAPPMPMPAKPAGFSYQVRAFLGILSTFPLLPKCLAENLLTPTDCLVDCSAVSWVTTATVIRAVPALRDAYHCAWMGTMRAGSPRVTMSCHGCELITRKARNVRANNFYHRPASRSYHYKVRVRLVL